MGLLSKLGGGDKSTRTIAIEIDPTEVRSGDLGEIWAEASAHGVREDMVRMFVGGALDSMGETQKSRIASTEILLAPDEAKWCVIFETNKLSDAEAAELEAVAAEKLSLLGKRLR